jgi:hypothetical protein
MLNNMSSNLITFIIPTIGRPSILQTIQSLRKLKKTNWESIIVFDGVSNLYLKQLPSPTFRVFEIPKTGGPSNKNHAGRVRNYAFPYVKTHWIGFVDDDDTLSPYYIDYLEKEIEIANQEVDVIIFRMIYKDMNFLPPEYQNDIQKTQVGISFCFRTSLIEKFPQLKFQNDSFEDYLFLQQCKDLHCKIIISPFISYYVKSTYFPFSKELPRHRVSTYSYSLEKTIKNYEKKDKKNMIYILCKGGLGNLCYQTFFGEWIRNTFQKDVFYIFDENESHHRKWIHQYSLFYSLPILPLSSCYPYLSINEEDFDCNSFYEQTKPIMYHGYFQNISRYKNLYDDLWKIYQKSSYEEMKKYFDNWKNKNICSNKKIIGIHIRGKDYLTLSHLYQQLPNSYFEKCFEKIGIEYHPDKYECIVFTDDIAYVKSNMKWIEKYSIRFSFEMINPMISIPPDEMDLYLLSFCNILILSNSTFSLWSSYLSFPQIEKVFIPSSWYKDNSVYQSLPNLLREEIHYECVSWDEESSFS